MERWSFTAHPASVGETYAQHFWSACKFSASMISAGFACFVHGLFPFVFVTTGSSTVKKLYDRMVTHRLREPPAGSKGGGAPA
jgi:hypothetical protein